MNDEELPMERRAAWGIGITIGIGVGVAVGMALDNFLYGLVVGVGMGVGLSTAFGSTGKPSQGSEASKNPGRRA
ncbi:hypothetical protein [Georgenia halophila]